MLLGNFLRHKVDNILLYLELIKVDRGNSILLAQELGQIPLFYIA